MILITMPYFLKYFKLSDYRINKLNIAQIFFLLFLASLFFPIRYVFPTKEAFQTGAYSDFTSISLYLSDIFLFTTWIFAFVSRGGGFWVLLRENLSIKTFILWLLITLIWHFSSFSSLNWWFLVKFLELIVAYETTKYLFSKTEIKPLFIRLFVILSSFQAILGLWQFISQKSVGLGIIGEQVLSPSLSGIAKIVSGGTVFIRAYGTFPHSNLLSVFLLSGIFFSLHLLLTSKKTTSKILFSLSVLIQTLGLTVTFSRASFLALSLGLVIYFGFLFMKASKKNEVWLSALVILISLIIAFSIFKPYLQTRATISDSASTERIFYSEIGLQMVKEYPVAGIGIGESVLHMQQYSPTKLWPWQIQPVHNYFLLSATELGILGALILIWIFLSHLFAIIKKLQLNISFELTTYYLLLTTFLCIFLLLMQFDHYFYTLQQTQMLLWVILGIIASQTKNPLHHLAEGDS